jgi:hypothetical protein
MNLVELLAQLESRAREVPGHLQKTLDVSLAFKSFTNSVSTWTEQAGRQTDQEAGLATQAFSKLDQTLAHCQSTVKQHMQQLNGVVSSARSQAQSETGEIESDLQICHQVCHNLTGKLDTFRQKLQAAGDHHRASLAAARASAQAARERLLQACDKTRLQVESLQATLQASAQSNEAGMTRVAEGIKTCCHSHGLTAQQFSNQTTAAADQLMTGLHQSYDQVVKPALNLRSTQYQGALQGLHEGVNQCMARVQSSLEQHDQAAGQHGSTLSTGYQAHKYHLLSEVVSTDQQLQQRNTTVVNAIAKLTQQRAGPPEDTRNWFQKAWDWVVNEVHQISGGIHAVWDHSSQPLVVPLKATPTLASAPPSALLSQAAQTPLLATSNLLGSGAALGPQDLFNGADKQAAQEIEKQMQSDMEKGQADRQKVLSDLQTKTFEIQQDVTTNKSQSADKAYKSMDNSIRGGA